MILLLVDSSETFTIQNKDLFVQIDADLAGVQKGVPDPYSLCAGVDSWGYIKTLSQYLPLIDVVYQDLVDKETLSSSVLAYYRDYPKLSILDGSKKSLSLPIDLKLIVLVISDKGYRLSVWIHNIIMQDLQEQRIYCAEQIYVSDDLL